MSAEIALHPFADRDGTASATLIDRSPDTGRIHVASHFEIDPYQALIGLHADTVGVAAESPAYDGPIGGGLIRFGECQFEDAVRLYALLNTLVDVRSPVLKIFSVRPWTLTSRGSLAVQGRANLSEERLICFAG